MGVAFLENLSKREPVSRERAQKIIDLSLHNTAGETTPDLNKETLTPLERALIIALFHCSANHKLHKAHTGFGRSVLPEANVPILWDKPDVVESSYNHRIISVPKEEGGYDEIPFSHHPQLIALCKATKTLAYAPPVHNAEELGHMNVESALDYVDLAYKVDDLFKDERGMEYLAPAHVPNFHGIILPSVGTDVMTYKRMPDGEWEAQYQIHDQTKEEYFARLLSFFEIQNGKMGKPVEMIAADGLVVCDLITQIAGFVRREATQTYDELSEDLLKGFVYGIGESVEIGSQVRTDILTVWGMFDPDERKKLFCGWEPEKGIDVASMNKINGGIANQCPILWLGSNPLASFLLSKRKPEALRVNEEIVKIVCADASHLNGLIRSLLQTIVTPGMAEKLLLSKESKCYRDIAHAANEQQRRENPKHPRIMTSEVIDFTQIPQDLEAFVPYLERVRAKLLVA